MIEQPIEVLAYAFKIMGVLFLLVAAVGVLRLPDAFTRMHAATKAGTLGAGLVVLGSALSVSGFEAVGLAVLTAIVLLATVPLASHLLARAAYTSGAPFWAGTASDALEGTLRRGDRPGEPEPEPEAATPEPFALRRIVLVPTHASEGRAARLAYRMAAMLDVRVELLGLIDRPMLTGAGEHAAARARMEAALGLAMRERGAAPPPSVRIEERAPGEALREGARPGDLVVLPPAGWFDHGVVDPDAAAPEPDGEPRTGRGRNVLPFAHSLPRPVMLAGDVDDIRRIVVLDDGGPATERALATLAGGNLFPEADLRITWPQGETLETARRTVLAAAAGRADLGFQAPTGAEGLVRDPGDLFVCTGVPGAARGDWYGTDWRDRIAPRWRGAVLLV